jgi:hypothetical protein
LVLSDFIGSKQFFGGSYVFHTSPGDCASEQKHQFPLTATLMAKNKHKYGSFHQEHAQQGWMQNHSYS